MTDIKIYEYTATTVRVQDTGESTDQRYPRQAAGSRQQAASSARPAGQGTRVLLPAPSSVFDKLWGPEETTIMDQTASAVGRGPDEYGRLPRPD